MTDLELIGVIADAVYESINPYVDFVTDGQSWLNDVHCTDAAREALAALDAAGYAWYRPDDCQLATVELGFDHIIPIDYCYFTAGEYRLVPVGGDS